MSRQPRTMRSPYMEWAKLHSAARYKLAGSGIRSYPLADLPVRLDQLEIDGPDSYGYPPLQERLAKRNGVAVDCVVAATGTSMANHLAMAALIQAGDEILMEQPTYELLLSLAHYLGAKVLRFPRRFEDGFAIDPQAVRKNLTKRTRLIVITNLHNPSSAPVDEKTLTSIGEMAEQLGARVLVDEVYREAIFDQPTRSAFHLGNHFIVTSSLTKAYGLSGLRCGWILAEAAVAEKMRRLNDIFGAVAPYTMDKLCFLALSRLPHIAARGRHILETNRTHLNEFFATRDDLETVPPKVGTTSFPRLRRGNVEELCTLLEKDYDTAVVPGAYFESPSHFRLGLCCEPEKFREGIARLSQALDRLPSSSKASPAHAAS